MKAANLFSTTFSIDQRARATGKGCHVKNPRIRGPTECFRIYLETRSSYRTTTACVDRYQEENRDGGGGDRPWIGKVIRGRLNYRASFTLSSNRTFFSTRFRFLFLRAFGA